MPLPVTSTGVPAASDAAGAATTPAASIPGTSGDIRITPGCPAEQRASL